MKCCSRLLRVGFAGYAVVASLAVGMGGAPARADDSTSSTSTAEELKTRALAYTSELARASAHVQALLRASRGRVPASELHCLDEGLSRIDVAAREANAAEGALVESLGRSDRRAADQAFFVVHAAYARGHDAATAANECALARNRSKESPY